MPGSVTVAYKGPSDLILRLFAPTKVPEAYPGGTRDVERWFERADCPRVVINGCATEHGAATRAPITGGYAMTYNVDADFWAAWMAQNKSSPLVTNRMLWAMPKQPDAMAEARTLEKLRSGLEPMLQEGDKRAAATRVGVADEQRRMASQQPQGMMPSGPAA